MEYRIIAGRTLFSFTMTDDSLDLNEVCFLGEDAVLNGDGPLVIKRENGHLEWFVSGKTRVAHLSTDQFRFLARVARFFRSLAGMGRMAEEIWLQSMPGQARETSGTVRGYDHTTGRPLISCRI
ncbi:hypothetical protein [Desulfolithobacter sp.]